MDVSVDTSACEAADWDAYVAAHPDASHYHSSRWRVLIEQQFGKPGFYLSARDASGAIQGVLPLIRLKSLLFGDFMVSMPYLNYGGLLVSSEAARDALLATAAKLGDETGVSHIELRHTREDAAPLPARQDKVAMILELPDSIDALGKAIGSKRRSQVRRPLREDPQIQVGGVELVALFYQVFARNMRDLGTPVYAQSFFEAIATAFPDDTQIVAITIKGEPAAAAFLIGHRGQLEIPWASTVRDFNRISINMLLYWEVLRYAIEAGYSHFDFGRSTIDAGTYRFKKQWGAEAKPMHWHYWLKDGGDLPALNPDNPKFQLLIRAWQRLPLPVANWLGPKIVRHLP